VLEKHFISYLNYFYFMPLFQNSIVNKYLNNQNKNLVLEQWTAFQNHFHNPNIQENIRKSKEEQYQEGFLCDLFVNILGYKLNPDADFNLTTELKNIKDSKKADGAIIINNIAKAVVELKGTNTTDLSKIETQAFSYKNNQKDCVYVITSNFEKLRFYIDNAIEYIEFNLFQLTFKEFELLFLCLAYSNIFNDIPKKVKEESINQEDVITKKLYKDYSLFKQELYQNLVFLNPQYDKVDLYKKSQKLLDRFLFVFFAEDRQLLPAYSVRSILKQWKLFKDWDDYRPLYDHYKTYFGFLVKGIKNETLDIFAYNGGLFENDVILDSIKIDDKLLYDHTLKISEYNFLSDVDVNILGHIFENSLNQLDELKAQNSDAAVEKTVSKRKKDGVFYTPKYITKYIVNNTVGKLCADKKESFQIIESEFFIDKKRTNDSKKTLLNKLTEYRNWLLQITIIDPACGSGAFLNEALNFLIEEHQYIDELQAKLFGDGLILSDVEMSILENNLFGVDLNEESAEIAKLSLWLRTARPNRKLNNLNNNIKCGNSLIDDPAIAGEKAFNWQKEFPKIFVEKQKQAFHITTAIHDSRTSQRMIDYQVREKRFMGTKPEPQVIPLTEEEELLITEIIVKIVVEDGLNVMAYNICRDHMHLVLVCEEEELSKIVQKIKSKTARAVNIKRGVTIIATEHAPLSSFEVTTEHAPLSSLEVKKEHAPLSSLEVTMEHVPLSSLEVTTEHVPLSSLEVTTERAPLSSFELTTEHAQLSSFEVTTEHVPLSSFELTTEHAPLSSLEVTTEHAPLSSLEVTTEHAPLSSHEVKVPLRVEKTRGVKQNSLWTQKFGCKEIIDEEQLWNTINYIRTNREKHNLPPLLIQHSSLFAKQQGSMLPCHAIPELSQSYENAFRPEFNGGFDVVIGNPPYVQIFDLKLKECLETNFEVFKRNNDLYSAFYEKSVSIIKNNGMLGFITPNSFVKGEYFLKLREFFIKHQIISIVDFNNFLVFSDANVFSAIIILQKESPTKNWILKSDLETIKGEIEIGNSNFIQENSILNKFKDVKVFDDYFFIKDVGFNYWSIGGEKTRSNSIGERVLYKGTKENINDISYVKGSNFNKYSGITTENYLKHNYKDFLNEQDTFRFSEELLKTNPKLIYRQTSSSLISTVDFESNYCDKTVHIIVNRENTNINLLYLMCVFNSKLLNYFYKISTEESGRAFAQVKTVNIKKLPFIETNDQIPFIEKAELMLSLNKDLQDVSQKVQRNLIREFATLATEHAPLLPKKLQDWYLLSYSDFLKELEKKKVKLSLTQKSEWESYFETESQKANNIKQQIETTDKQIDAMVYQLYGLTQDEIEIVEKG
jgi:TaqI-like C-terminal specificity domain/Eco57I restriction-modification methylase/Transposase IS200 like